MIYSFLNPLHTVKVRAKLFYLCFVLLFISSALFSQKQYSAKIDSLKGKQYKPDDTASIRHMLSLADLYLSAGQTDSSLKYAGLVIASCDRNLMAAKDKTSRSVLKTLMLLKAMALENKGACKLLVSPDEARRMFLKSIELIQKLNDKPLLAETYNRIGSFYSQASQYDEALANYKSALLITEELNNSIQLIHSHELIGDVYYASGDYSAAEKSFQSALTISSSKNNQTKKAHAFRKISDCQKILGHYGDALENGLNALQLSEAELDTNTMVNALIDIGSIYVNTNNYKQALRYDRDALNILNIRGDSAGIAKVYTETGYIYAEQGHFDTAFTYYTAAIPILERRNEYYNLWAAYYLLSHLFEKQGKFKEAIEYSRASLENAQHFGNKKFIAVAYLDLAESYGKLPDNKNAEINYQKAYDVSRTFGLAKQQTIAALGLAELRLLGNKSSDALTWLRKADSSLPASEFSIMKNLYEKYSRAFSQKGDFENAFQNFRKFKQFSDSANAKEKAEKLTALTNRLDFEYRLAMATESQEKTILMREAEIKRQKLVRNVSLAGLLIFIIFGVTFYVRFREKRKLNIALETTLTDLKSVQAQLIQQEKLASLGELTAGIAHEIQNPLNFVTNFSDVSGELLSEMKEDIHGGKIQDALTLADDIEENLEKISFHGKKADAIVKAMLLHSRTRSGKREPTDINALVNEYLRLAYHGFIAKEHAFDAKIETTFDQNIGDINIIPQDISRVLVNLFNNALYAVAERKKHKEEGYQPTVSVFTKRLGLYVEILIKDNGVGVAEQIRDKIFLPFFTTRTTGEGTGLGLSLSYDIIKAHGGEIRLIPQPDNITCFRVLIPVG